MARPKIRLDTTILIKIYSLGIKLSIIATSFGVSIRKIETLRNDLNLPLRNGKVVYDEN